MGFLDAFKLGGWQPDLEREPPPKQDWPSSVKTLNSKKFDKFINKYPLSIVDFWAPWCRPCHKLAPRIRQLSKEYKGRVAFGKLNVDEYKNVAQRYHLLSIPNLIFFSYGEKITNLSGVRSFNEIQKKIDDILLKFND
jgi:thioredoxin 1